MDSNTPANFFNILPIGAIEIDPSTSRIVKVNPAFCKMIGYSESELNEKTVFELSASASHDAMRARLKDFQAGNEVAIKVERQYITKEKKLIWVLFHVVRMRNEGANRDSIFATVQDISEQKLAEAELKRSEARYRLYADSLPQIAYITDSEGKVSYFNDRHFEYTGKSRGQTEGLQWKEEAYVHPDDVSHTFERWMQSITSGEHYEIEHRLRRYDGEYRWHLCRALPMYDSNQKIVQWFGTSTDIHENKSSNNALKQALEMRDEFLSLASHELKTPITSLKLNTSLQLRKIERSDPSIYEKEKIQEFIQAVDKSASKLMRLIENVFNLSHLKTQKLTLKKENFDLEALIESIVVEINIQFRNAKVAEPCFKNQARKKEGFWDRYRLEEAIGNLLTNALKYGSGKPIEIQLDYTDQEAIIRVEDHGIGISPENLEKIFLPYERAVNKNEVAGLGLGLYLTKEIVAAHQGQILVQSVFGKGSTFTITLPLH